jgi:hypothetical protein
MFVLVLAGLEADWPNENPEEGVDVDVDVEPNENPEEAGWGLRSTDLGAEELPNENPEDGAAGFSESGFGADEDPKENPDEGAGALVSVSDFGADEEPNENPDEGAGVLDSVSDLWAVEEPNENPDDGAEAGDGDGAAPSLLFDCEDDPKEKDEAEGPLGDPLGGTAAPKANAVDGEVFGCLAPKENENDFAGVDVSSVGLEGAGDSSFFSAGADWPKLNPDPPEGVSFFSLEASLAGWPNVNGDEEEPADTVGTKPPPEGVDVEGFNSPKPEVGTEGGLGIEGAAAGFESVCFESALLSCPGLQPDFWAISSRCLVTCSDSDASVPDRSQNGSSLIAFESALTSEELRPRMEVQYWISDSEASVLELPFPFAVVEVDAGDASFWAGAGVGLDEDPNENGAAGFELDAAGAADWPNENDDVDLGASAAAGSLDFLFSSGVSSSFLVSLVSFCPKPKEALCFSASVSVLADCPKPNEDPEAGAPKGEAAEPAVLGVDAAEPLKPNVEVVEGAELWPKLVEVEVEGVEPESKLKAGAEGVGVASMELAAGLPNENPPNGLGFGAAGAGAGVGAAGVDEAPNENPAEGVVEGADDAWPNEKEPNGEDEAGAAAGVGAWVSAYTVHSSMT